ncbi:unnamed protein product [Oikopleura dioica]|uniref:Metallo-beta-lactamase domain-containing protein n=1 Tax=Oikopleura dioica TaxID=34765 RepID=E4YML0_OIKDI|nr:unnamed protein product [Oikopleura dioica]
MANMKIIFRQLFEKETSTFTYLLGCKRTRKAIIIDPVDITVNRDAEQIRDLNLNLAYAINSHVHADHITGTHKLRSFFPEVKTGLGSGAKIAKSDEKFPHLHILTVGGRFAVFYWLITDSRYLAGS